MSTKFVATILHRANTHLLRHVWQACAAIAARSRRDEPSGESWPAAEEVDGSMAFASERSGEKVMQNERAKRPNHCKATSDPPSRRYTRISNLIPGCAAALCRSCVRANDLWAQAKFSWRGSKPMTIRCVATRANFSRCSHRLLVNRRQRQAPASRQVNRGVRGNKCGRLGVSGRMTLGV